MANKALPFALFLPVCLSLGCSSDDGGSLYGSDGNAVTLSTTNTDETTDPTGDGDPTGDDDPTTAGESGIKLDVLGGDTTMGTAGDAGDGNGCKKVDFLFIIDNSKSMLEEQDNLAASFPSFINTISTTLEDAQDYHVMVIDTDAWVFAGCPILCGFPLPGICSGYECGVTQPMQCENVLGAGVTWPRGSDTSNTDCNFASGKRYIDSSEPNLVSAFQCAARVGTGSTDDPERPMEAMVAAVSGTGPVGFCNEGFLRDDAILVVTYITDEDDNAGDGSSGGVDLWRDALIAAKNGDESAIVALGLFGDDDLPNAICNGNAESSPRLRQFTESWGANGFFGSICAANYNAFFQSAVDIIDTTCDEFMPPG